MERNNKPKTAWDVRRYITLVQVLAADNNSEAIRALCTLWNVDVVEDRSTPAYRGQHYMNVWATLINLARHVKEYHKQDTNTKTERK